MVSRTRLIMMGVGDPGVAHRMHRTLLIGDPGLLDVLGRVGQAAAGFFPGGSAITAGIGALRQRVKRAEPTVTAAVRPQDIRMGKMPIGPVGSLPGLIR